MEAQIAKTKIMGSELRDISDRLYKISEQVPGVLFQFRLHTDGSSCLPYASKALYDIYRVTPEEVRDDTKKLFAVVHPDDLEGHLASIQTSAHDLSPWRNEYRLRFSDGKECWLFGNALPQREPDGSVIWYGFITDITERREREHQVKLYQSLFEVTEDCVYIISPKQDFKMVFANNATCQHYGVEREQLLKWRIPDWDPNFKNQADLDALWQEIKTKKGIMIETIHQVASGREIPVEVSGNYLSYQDEEYIAGYFHDIAERKKMEDELKRSNAELNQFAYAVSHDMRQPLRMITSYLSLIEKKLSEQLDEDTKQYLSFATDGAKRMDQMILAMLDLSRVGRKSDPITPISSRDLLDDALATLNPDIVASGGTVAVTGNWPELAASRDELTRLLQNLIGNALKYHEQDQPPRIEIDAAATPTLFRVTIRDHGIGIDPNQTERLFKIFSRLQARTRFEGTGIGLALCRKIVEHHGGRIGVESAGEGYGSTFWFELPRTAAPEKPLFETVSRS